MGIKIRRSILILPVNQRKFVEKAHTRGADAICLDLEDSIPPAEKAGARKLAHEGISLAARGGGEVLVRINNDPDLICDDVDAAVYPGLSGIIFPKVESTEQVHRLNGLIEAKERERGMTPGSTKISVRIETPLGLLNARTIGQEGTRIESMGVGSEDYCLSLGVEPSEDGSELLYALAHVVTICKAMKFLPIGLMGTVAGFRDLKGFERAATRARQLGVEGSPCIHPDQVTILHQVFSPSAERVQYARRVVQAFEEGVKRGTASVSLDGKMIDIPIYERARIIFDRAAAIQAVERRKAEALAKTPS